ncbi:MAG TPA: phosphatidylglycerophosphatase A [Bacteroidota bacterium]|nr:phosphatidylglycerophosphatase A [Bacteroidota bacterium]
MNSSAHPVEPSPQRPLPFWVRMVATGFFSGYIPWASGTFGSLVGLLLWLIPGVHTPEVLFPLLAAGFFLGVYTSGEVAAREGHALSRSAAVAKRLFQGESPAHADPSIVVIDEIVGMWIALFGFAPEVYTCAFAFIAFRAFDILKPEPARSSEALPGGWGIMLDDVFAGLYANIATRAAFILYSALMGLRGGA